MSNRDPKGPRHPFHVLVVESDPHAIEATKLALPPGAKLTLVSDVSGAISVFESDRPNAIVAGASFSDGTCFELLAECRARVARREFVPIIVLTPEGVPVDARQAIKAGFLGILGKPVPISTLAAALRGAYRITHTRSLRRAKRVGTSTP